MTSSRLSDLWRVVLCGFALTLFAVGTGARTPAAPDPVLAQALGAEIDRFVAADRTAPPEACQVLFVGSSSIVKWKESLAADMAPMTVINRGFGGSHIEHVNRWFEEIVAPYRPRAIVFYAGENDIDAGKSVDTVVADFDTFMARKTQALGKTPVYFISLKPSKLRFAQFPLQSRVNDAIRARAAKGADLRYIDVVAPMLENGKPKDIFGPDGLHMTPPGYVIWTRAVRAALLPNTEAEERSCRHGS
jgi:lysophospholipase L1-like esterase